MDFPTAYERFIGRNRVENSSPERRQMLEKGLGFAELAFLENVWWPLLGNFDYLHPEYEVTDYNGGSRFIDFAYLRGKIKLAIEIDGFSTHAKQLNRGTFAYRLRRQNVLVVDGWDVLRFPFDDVSDSPRRCQQTIQQYLGSRFADNRAEFHSDYALTPADREVVRLARGLPAPLAPADVQRHLRTSRTTAYRRLRKLVDLGLLAPASGKERIRTYELTEAGRHLGI